jgi:hypothetical protein
LIEEGWLNRVNLNPNSLNLGRLHAAWPHSAVLNHLA